VFAGFFYIWKKGALDWTQTETSKAHKPPTALELMLKNDLEVVGRR